MDACTNRLSHFYSIFSVFLLTCGTPFAVHAQQPADPETAESAPVQVELFHGPKLKGDFTPSYPQSELYRNLEGWVEVGFMIDKQGKPYEVMVLDASGEIKALHETAMRAAEKWSFEPATHNGQPIDSAMSRKVIFTIPGREQGAHREFVRAYRDLMKALEAKDRSLADAAMAKMKVMNLYEDAYYGFAQYNYARNWGDQAQQLAGVRRAVAREARDRYLPMDMFRAALEEQFRLEVKEQDYARALTTWHTLQRATQDKTILSKWQSTVNQMLALKNDNRSYKVTGQLKDGIWFYHLFKRRFHINVIEGHVSQVKLYCTNGFVFFQYDPALEYSTQQKQGSCWMELVGDAQAKVELIQR